MEDLHGLAISSFQPEIVASATRVKLAIRAAAHESMLISLLSPFLPCADDPLLGCSPSQSGTSWRRGSMSITTIASVLLKLVPWSLA
jgi:hypothetical protein